MQSILCQEIWNKFKENDLNLAKKVKLRGCPFCKGCLDWANFYRKPRGYSELGMEVRYSLCCRDCRKRVTTHSVRFLWRKVYILLAVFWGPLKGGSGATKRTIGRWSSFWSETFSHKNIFCVMSRYKLAIDFSFDLKSAAKQFEVVDKIKIFELAEFLCPLGGAPWLRFRYFHAEDAS